MSTEEQTPEIPDEEGEKKISKKQQKKMAKMGNKKEKMSKEEKMKMWASNDAKKEKKPKSIATATAEELPFVNPTPKGQKKDCSGDLAASYIPHEVECAWSDWWEASGFFSPDVEKAKNAKPEEKFVMVIPPPNVTGTLHIGHGLTIAIEDTITRWKRMKGFHTLWVPGVDHAGIATQVVVEKALQKEEGKTRHDLGREEFVKKVWSWKEQYGNKIISQLKLLGASVDWSRETFTLDPKLSRAVNEAFCRMFKKGLIYRDNRLVNWCCTLKTAISDIEVEYLEIDKPIKRAVPGHDPNKKYEFGYLTHFVYQVENSDEYLEIATTRLETMLGDTAVAVHPDDPRYKHLHGKYLIHPFNNRRIPIICDPILVDMNFGTGAVKVTPAHDPNDFACGQRNKLEFINILTEDGKINENGGKQFEGMMRFDARVAVEKALEEKGLLRGKEPNKMQIPICSRSKDIIEPMIVPQWYVNCKEMAVRSVEAVRKGELKILPEMHVDTWYKWLENIRDWCISRQLWWGHRIPAYEIYDKTTNKKVTEEWCVGKNEEEALRDAKERLNINKIIADDNNIRLEQDPDVLDTWFSSGLFPFSVFGWPNNESDELKAFYPTTLLETGHDILFFWVARMVMMGLELTDQLPFNTIYLHALIRDKYGRKMSKTLGNVVDPREIIDGAKLEQLIEKLYQGNLDPKEIEKAKQGKIADFPNGIPECGADALRFGLLAYTCQGRDINLDINRIVGYRQFCNKLWNATKFALTNLNLENNKFEPPVDYINDMKEIYNTLAFRDKWILSKLHRTCKTMNEQLESFDFSPLTTSIYNFWLYNLCDVYLELIKPIVRGNDKEAIIKAQKTLYICLDYGLKLLHPIMPYITEELWQRIPGRNGKVCNDKPSIMLTSYPECDSMYVSDKIENEMSLLLDIIHSGRAIRAEYMKNSSNSAIAGQKAKFYISCNKSDIINSLKERIDDFKTLCNAESVVLVDSNNEEEMKQIPVTCGVSITNESVKVHMDLANLVDFDAEITKLKSTLQQTNNQLTMTKKKTEVPDYETKVPENIRNATSEKIAALEQKVLSIEEAIHKFESMKLKE